MILFILNFCIMLPILPILYFYFKQVGNFQNGKCLLVNLPYSSENPPKNNQEFLEITTSFKKSAKQILFLSIGTLILANLMLLTPLVNSTILLTLTLLIPIFLPIFLYNNTIYKHRTLLLTLKKKMEWSVPTENIVLADLATSRSKNAKTPNSYLFALPLLLSLLIYFLFPQTQGKTMLILLLTNMGIQLLFWLIHHSIAHSPAKIYTDNSSINIALNQSYRKNWALVYLFLSFLQAFWMLFLAAFQFRYITNAEQLITGFFIAIMVLMTLIPLLLVSILYQRHKNLETHMLQFEKHLIQDEDAYYEYHGAFWGYLYNNPNSKASIINKAYGMGQTMNIGSKKGRALFTGTKIFLYGITIGTLFIIGFEDLVTPDIQLQQETMTIYQTLYPTTIPKDHIQDVELVYDPINTKNIYRTYGSGTGSILRGEFKENGETIKAFIFKKVSPYIVIHLKNSTIKKIYYNDKNPKKTEEIFEKLQSFILLQPYFKTISKKDLNSAVSG